jgi:O-antigen/teichoic acid export membrane protein
LSVRGAATDRERLRQLAGHSLGFTLVLALPLSIGVIVMVSLLHHPGLIPYALAALFLWQLQETLRRALMAHLRHSEALLGDAISYLGQVGAILLLAHSHRLTLETTFLAISATSLLAVVVQTIQLRPYVLSSSSPSDKRPAATTSTVLQDYWALGKLVLLTNGISLVTVQAMPWTLGYFHGDAVADFAALAQTMGVTNPVIISLGGLIVPAVAMSNTRGGVRSSRRVALGYGLSGACLLLPFYAIVFITPEFVIKVMSHNNPAYMGLGNYLRLFALSYLLAFPAHVTQALLNGLGRTGSTFLAQCAFSTVTLLVSLPLAAAFGLSGAVWGGVLPAVAYVVTSFFMLRRASADDDRAARRETDPGHSTSATSSDGSIQMQRTITTEGAAA